METMNFEDLCMGCMKNRGGLTVCLDCGWDDSTQSDSTIYLPLRTILNHRYLIGKVLGQGGFGITYLAWDIPLKMPIAIKEFFPKDLATRSANKNVVTPYIGKAATDYEYGLSKFLEEAQVLSRFRDHPGIVSVYEFFNANETAYMVMQYLEGMTLKAYLEKEGGRIPFKATVDIMMPVMDALREVHGLGLLHRDISPDNIYITSNNQVKLLDFGAARYAIGEYSKSLSIILKQGYAPEEQYRSKGKQGPWTDIYAVAATIYRVITGETPPDALDRMDNDTVRSRLQSMTELSTKEKVVLMKALSINALNRYRSIQELQEALTGDEVPVSEVSDTVRLAPETKIKEQKKTDAPRIAVRQITCKNHPQSEARWRCINCHSEFCENCVDIIQVSSLHSTAICRKCRDMCIDLLPDKKEVSKPRISVRPKQKKILLVSIIIVASIVSLYFIISNLTILKEYMIKNAANKIAKEIDLAVTAYKKGEPFLITDHTGLTECVSTRPTTGGVQLRQKCNGIPALYQCGDLKCLVHLLVYFNISSKSPFDKSQPLYNDTAGSAGKIGTVVLEVIDNNTVHIYAYGKNTEEPISSLTVSPQ
jgi:serine/threonine protein kinase